MKFVFFLLPFIFLFAGCSTKEVQKEKPKEEPKEIIKPKEEKPVKKEVVVKTVIKKIPCNIYYPEEFIFKKDQIGFFEKEFKNITKIKNKPLLEKYLAFFKNNASYFKNSQEKITSLEKSINQSEQVDENSHKYLLTKALSLTGPEAIPIYEKLAKEGNIFAMRELANIYKYDNRPLSIVWYKELEKNDDIQGIKEYALANLHGLTPIVEPNAKKAVELYEKLYKLGEYSSLIYLGNIYEYGYFKDDFPVDKQKAFEYFKIASDKGFTAAQKKLSKIYLCEECEGNRYDKEKGKELLKLLISKGDKESRTLLKELRTKEIEETIEELKPKEEIKESEAL